MRSLTLHNTRRVGFGQLKWWFISHYFRCLNVKCAALSCSKLKKAVFIENRKKKLPPERGLFGDHFMTVLDGHKLPSGSVGFSPLLLKGIHAGQFRFRHSKIIVWRQVVWIISKWWYYVPNLFRGKGGQRIGKLWKSCKYHIYQINQQLYHHH